MLSLGARHAKVRREGYGRAGAKSASCAIASTDAVATGGAMDEAAKHSEELIHTYSEDGILLTGALVHRGRTALRNVEQAQYRPPDA